MLLLACLHVQREVSRETAGSVKSGAVQSGAVQAQLEGCAPPVNHIGIAAAGPPQPVDSAVQTSAAPAAAARCPRAAGLLLSTGWHIKIVSLGPHPALTQSCSQLTLWTERAAA